MFKNITLSKKLACGFGVVLMALVLIVVLSFTGVGGIVTNAKEVIYGNHLDATMIQKEVDHLNWASRVNQFLADEKVTKLNVQTDSHKCGLGKWLYSDKRKRAETSIPALVSILKELEQPHRQLHESAIHIGEVFIRADAELPGIIAARQLDHLKWAGVIKDTFLENRESLTIQTDPTKCALGKWILSEHGNKTYNEGSSRFKQEWDGMVKSHEHLHKSAIDIQDKLAAKDHTGAKEIFNENTIPVLHTTLGHLDSMKTAADHALAGMSKANTIYAEHTMPNLKKIQSLLRKARETVKDNIMGQKAMLGAAIATKQKVGFVGAIGTAAGVIAALLIAQGIIMALRRVINALTEGFEQVSSASSQVSSASQSLAEGATEQAAGLEETSSSLEEMASMTKQNADNAQQANTLASDARKAADTGNQSMGKMNDAIVKIQKSSDETAKIIKVIDEIAFQTNLLALNAAVEAARAGEAGKGFAVVAEEVRNLAMRSAEAAKNTSELIEESVKNSKNGVDIAGEVAKVLEEIVSGIGKTSELVGEIAAASAEQAQGIDQVNTAVNQMDKVTQSNAANAEESASASEELSAQAEQMNEVVNQLVAMVGGKTSTSGNSSSNRQKEKGTKKSLNTSDHAFHQISGGTAKATPQKKIYTTAEKAIPFAGDSPDDVDGFNS